MTWRLAQSLDVLRDEINARWPERDKSSDGTLGDPAHAARRSDHNPNAAGVVRAMDITGAGDSMSGPDVPGAWLAEHVRSLGASGFAALQNHGYVIHAGRAAYASRGWGWVPYRGASPHSHHVHISVGRDPAQYDDGASWAISSARPAPAPIPPSQEDDMPYTPEELSLIVEQAAKKAADQSIREYMAQPDNRLFKFLRQLVGKG